MKQVLPGLAKRALAFMLAFVLLLSLVPSLPLTANAAVQTDGWEYNSSYKKYYKTAEFVSSDADLVYEDDQPYDWQVHFSHTYTVSLTPTLTASITDENGKQIGETVTVDDKKLISGTEYTILNASDFPALTTNLAGKFTLVMEMYNGSTFMAKLTKTFSRTIAVSIESSVSSRSNPDNVFTFADPIDLVLNIKHNNGVAATYNAAVTVANASGTELLAARGLALPASTNITLSVKDLVDLPSITTAGAYKVNLTLTDSQGEIQHQSSHDFSVVALKDNLAASVTSPTSGSMTFNGTTPDVVVNLQKTDGLAETFNTYILITNQNGSKAFEGTFETNVPATGIATVTPDLPDATSVGTYKLAVTITDDAGNFRGSTSATFTITNTTPMTCTLIDNSPNNVGKIYYSGSDINMRLSINHKASASQNVTIKVIGNLNGKYSEQNVSTVLLGGLGTRSTTITGSNLPYGTYEDVRFAVFNSSGTELWRSEETFTFSRIPTAGTPGSLPLLNINDHFTSGKGDGAKKLALAAKTGANMWRACIPWASIEKAQGSYDISIVESVMNATKANDMQALIILAYGNEDVYGESNPGSEEWLNAYANYCYYVASMMALYYPDEVVGFEIWNEWNHATMSKVTERYRTGAYYVKVVKAASEKIRQVNAEYGTNFKVIAGATAGDAYGTTSSSYKFVTAMFRASGFFDAVDGVSFHTYSSKETTNSWNNPREFEYISPAEHDFAARITNYKNLLTQYNAPDDLEIWLTETGWTTNSVPESTNLTSDGKTHITTGATEQEAAAYLVQLYAWALADGTLDRIFWYDFMNDISNQTKIWANNQTESNYGLIHNWNNSGDQPLAYSAKPGYVAMCALSSKLTGAINGKTIKLGDGIFAYQFEKGNNYIMVAWTDGSVKTLNATFTGNMVITDMYGNASTYSSSATLNLSEAPIYIEYAKSAHPSIG